jgi:hypothetical protein
MPAEREGSAPGYRLGSRERRGLLAGWRGGQVGAVAISLVLAVGMLRGLPSPAGMVGAVLAVLGGAGLACWPVRGRAADEWLPALGRQALLRLSRQDRWRSAAPHSGIVVGASPVVVPAHRRPERTGSVNGPQRGLFGALSVEEGTTGDGSLCFGVVRDHVLRTRSAVIALSGAGFALLGKAEQGERVAAWARVLATIAREGTTVHRIQWVERCIADRAERPRRFAARAVPPAGSAGAVPPEQRSYLELLDLASTRGYRHEVYVVVSVRDRRSTPRGRRGALDPSDPDTTLLAREAASLEQALRQAGADVEGVLSPAALRAVLGAGAGTGSSMRPGARGRAHLAPPRRARDQPAPAGPWPLAVDIGWDAVRTDGCWHASYWIAEWPRTEVGPDFLLPLITGVAAQRTVSVTMAPVGPLRASRAAEHARTSGVADAELRRRHGFAVTARARRDHDSVLQRESELALGHASYRFSGFVTVTAAGRDELDRSCEAVERAAALAQLELRRLYGAQDQGLLASLPAGRGLD